MICLAIAIPVTGCFLADAGIVHIASHALRVAFRGTKIFTNWSNISDCLPLEIMNVNNTKMNNASRIRFKIKGGKCKSGGSIANSKLLVLGTAALTIVLLK